MSNLSIFKASAGSGKTYNLTWNYLEILFAEPEAYKSILAVTFTNKAAGEMKSRILESLWHIGRGDSQSKEYSISLQNKFSISEEDVKLKASDILCRILNDYSSFYVGTIDRFFQWIIRGFIREIGLQTAYNLELNNDRILHEAVDQLMFRMEDDDKLRTWLISFAEDRIREGKSWNFQKDVFALGKEVFRESYQVLHSTVPDASKLRDDVIAYKKDLRDYLYRFEAHISQLAKNAVGIISSAGLNIEDFKYGNSGVAGYLNKITDKRTACIEPPKRAISAAENAEAWLPNKPEYKAFLSSSGFKELMSVLNSIIQYHSKNKTNFTTARLLVKNIYAFGILSDISEQIREICLEKNIFLLSDASLFLKKIIGSNEAPFIYEKAGNYFNRFMLDEFQDTSQFQWDNFLPLVRNGLSEGYESLIVGDVKQSIYRWRNSDWKILAAGVQNELHKFDPVISNLDTNWRSHEDIVNFNNSFFRKAKVQLQDMIRCDLADKAVDSEFLETWTGLAERVYSDADQKVCLPLTGKTGLVEHSFHIAENKDSYREIIKEKIPELIRDLQDRNFQAKDITFLVRKQSEGKEIASVLLAESLKSEENYNFNVISNDSLFLVNNPAVLFLISVLRYITNPDDHINSGFLRNEYFTYLAAENMEATDIHKLFSTRNFNEFSSNPVFATFNNRFDFLKRLPLYELMEELIVIFELNRVADNLPFIQALQDIILDFIRDESVDISAFLNFWEKNGASFTLNISEAQDAIRIMTIHKSKGLQFQVVIMPFCNWPMEPGSNGFNTNYIWCETANTLFNRLPFMPVVYGNDMRDSAFISEYYSEKFHSYIDNLNLLYVSFTRAVKELHIFSQLKKPDPKPDEAGGFSFNLYKENENFQKENMLFSLGSRECQTILHNEQVNVFMNKYPVNIDREKLRLNLKNAYLSQMEEDTTQKLGYGTIMHEIFSYIKSTSDIDYAVNKLKMKGKLDAEEAVRFAGNIKIKFQRSEVAGWFDNKYIIRNEHEMISDNSEILRPDRVMMSESEIIVLDFKFGDIQNKKHEKQVITYKNIISGIEKRDVKAYLWYFDLDEIKEVI